MQFITGMITSDVDYLLYLLLKQEKIKKVTQEKETLKDKGYLEENALEDWFNKL